MKKITIIFLCIILLLLSVNLLLAWDTSTCDIVIWTQGNDCPNGEPVVYNGTNYYCTTSCGYAGALNGKIVCLCMKTFPYLLGD